MTNNPITEKIFQATQGNPGAINVFMTFIQSYGYEWTVPVIDRFIWLIAKDECNMNLEKAKGMLDEWMITDLSLGQWIVDKGLKSAPEAKYYLENP